MGRSNPLPKLNVTHPLEVGRSFGGAVTAEYYRANGIP